MNFNIYYLRCRNTCKGRLVYNKIDHVYNRLGGINEISPKLCKMQTPYWQQVHLFIQISVSFECESNPRGSKKYQGNNYLLCYFDVDKIWLLAASTLQSSCIIISCQFFTNKLSPPHHFYLHTSGPMSTTGYTYLILRSFQS